MEGAQVLCPCYDNSMTPELKMEQINLRESFPERLISPQQFAEQLEISASRTGALTCI